MSTSHAARIALLEQLVEFAPDALLVIDASGRIVLTNRTAEALFGFGSQELLGQPVERLVPERLRGAHVEHRGGYARNPRTREMGATVAELVAARHDGTEFPVEIRLAPIEVGGERLVAAAVRDVTDRRREARELYAARQEAERANAAKSRFLATASHDLRQPLQALELLNAALRRQAGGKPSQELLDHEADAIASMGRLLESLLDVTRLETGRVVPELEDVDMAALTGALRQQFGSMADARGLAFEVDVGAHCIRTDPTLFRQLLENLLANAIKYTDSGGVRLSCSAVGDGLRVTVADTGIGIAPEHLGSIFDEFYQVQRHDRTRGVGLGLSIVKRYARLLGVTVGVQSEIGHGTRFHIDIPRSLVVPTVPDRTSAPAAPPTAEAAPRAVILLIEDDDAVRKATSMYLEAVGHSVMGVASCGDAERALRSARQRPDLIISDYRLGDGATGVDAIRRIRTTLGADLPALVLSGDPAGALGAVDGVAACRILSKPVGDEALSSAIEALLPGH